MARTTSPLRIATASFVLLASMASVARAAEEKKVEKPAPKPVPVEASSAKIGPKNSRIEFVGLHTGDDPKPRLGGFKKFDGVLVVDGETLKGISVEIEVDSIWTEFDKLTQHLQAADFLNTKEFPTAKFTSSKIAPTDKPGVVSVTGKLDFHGVESEITFPAKVTITDKGLVLKSKFELDRTQFAMTEHTDGVEKLVSVEVVVGQATKGAEDEQKKEAAAKAEATKTSKATSANQPKSGLAVGEEVEPWTPVHVAGPDKGTRTCPVCTYLGCPAVVVFAKKGDNTERLLAEVEKLCVENGDKLKGFVAVLDASPAELELIAAQNGVTLASLCYPDDKTGAKDLAAYHVNPEVANTVMVYKDYKVTANFIDLKATDVAKLESAVERVLN
ncbi:YceI family protein [Aeoliella sp. SH292]|uniref:YceI family protein n=1 Tax=Aeoliella sp. SH292 TaxID=3454464 RepID=UPI003F9C228F